MTDRREIRARLELALFPPLSEDLIDTAVAAVGLAASGRGHQLVEAPNGLRIPAGEILALWLLDDCLEDLI